MELWDRVCDAVPCGCYYDWSYWYQGGRFGRQSILHLVRRLIPLPYAIPKSQVLIAIVLISSDSAGAQLASVASSSHTFSSPRPKVSPSNKSISSTASPRSSARTSIAPQMLAQNETFTSHAGADGVLPGELAHGHGKDGSEVIDHEEKAAV